MRSGTVQQPCRGLYALPTAAPDYVALLQRRQLLTCVSAAPFYRLWALEQTGLRHVYHWRGDAVGAESGHGGLLFEPHPHRPVAALGDVLIHALRCLPFRESLVMVELDGRHHGDWAQVRKDQRRNNRSVVQGYVVLRYYYADVVHDPAAMVAQVLTVLAGVKSPG